ncbi:hypothetical protein F5X96DRAFT_47709 [Biscogniauxia mediterranea]|nr:hypothetical protein F5X96DRAFT_47709 [Biscogniauxia mediterranea]
MSHSFPQSYRRPHPPPRRAACHLCASPLQQTCTYLFLPSRASRYTGSRYDGDSRRSRSRDRSPDRRSLYSDGGPRRSSAESRANSSAFQANRDSFRDTLPRDTPRGPKALLDPPSGPRGGGYSGDFRGRGRGRGRGWRDDSRDRGRDRDIDFRDRRDTSYRDERSRERDRGDWRDRDRDSFRGRRPSPRARSPPGRDFRDSRDLRDGPLGVDAERARRGSRDGPLSAGSSSSDPPFGHSSYRGGYSNRGRGGRGRGDWDNRPRGRAFYDDRDRYGPSFRSRSQEGRYRDREDRERDTRYLDADLRSRDPRDDRDNRDREVRPKIDRTSHEPPQATKDVSPPPVAPAAPSFGSVPNRTTTSAEIGSVTGKAPPTGPRALKEERPAPIVAPPNIVDTRAPPTGPSKSSFVERSPPIPSGPRSTRSGPSSKQWINPNLKNRVPESPKPGRSQSFAQARPAGFRPEGSHTDQQVDTTNQRPRSSDAKADSQVAAADDQLRDLHLKESNEDAFKFDRRPQSAGSSLDRDYKLKDAPGSAKTDDGTTGTIDHSVADDPLADKDAPVPFEGTKARPNRRPTLKMHISHVSLPDKQAKQPIIDQSSESDDEEFGDIIESGLADVEAKLKQFEGVEDIVPMDAIIRHAMVCVEAVAKVVTEPEGLVDMVGPIPEDVVIPGKTPTKPDAPAKEPTTADDVVVEKENIQVEVKPIPKEKTHSPIIEPTPTESTTLKAELPQPSIEQDMDMPAPQEPTIDEKKPGSEDGNVTMEDVKESRTVSEVPPPPPPPPLPPVPSCHQSLFPPFEDAQIQSRDESKRPSSTPSPPEDEDETDVEDIDLQSIEIVREHMVTPPIDSLPYFDEKPWDKDLAFLQSMDALHPSLNNFILRRLKEEAQERMIKEDRLRQEYDEHYDAYLRFTRSDDPVAVKSREKFDYASGNTEGTGHKPGFNVDQPKQESTRRSRYASERDLERILEESRRVEDEKRERQLRAEQEKYRTDTKEAVIPCQYLTPEDIDNEFYNDTTGYINAEKTVAAWQVLPPVANFTEEETATFEKAYLEFPKQWGRVAEPLLERDFGTAIQFYYLKKEKSELNLKEKLKKQPRRRKKGGRGKQRSSALVSELGNGDNEAEEAQETGENGERRRPRRAAAPTFNSEATPATDGESGTPAGTPGRRGGGSRGDGSEKPERKPRGRRAAKDKEPKQPRVNQTLAAAPPAGAKGNRSRSSSRAQGPDWIAQQAQNDTPRIQPQYELAPSTTPVPPVAMQATFQPAHTQTLISPERGPPPPSLSEVMAPPPLRPEPPPQPTMSMLDMGQPTLSDRKSNTQASSYWSVPETTDFPSLLRSFGSDWAAIAGHMRTKTAVMVKNYYARRKDTNDWEAIVQEADNRKARGEKRPPPPLPSSGVKKRYDTSVSRPLAAADTIMDDAPPTKLEHPSTTQSMTGRFNVPIAAQPQPTVVQSPFVQTPQPPPLVQAHATSQPRAQPLTQAVTQTMSPSTQPLRAPVPFSDREREQFIQQPGRTPLVQKPTPPAPPPISEPPMRHPLPGPLMDSQAERPKPEPKPQKEPARHQERPMTRVKQEPDLIQQHHQHELFTAQPPSHRMTNSRVESIPLSRPPEPPRAVAPAPQAPFAAVLQQQPNRGLLSENHPSPPAPPRPLSNLSNLSRPMSGASGGAEPYSTPPAQRTPPAVAPPPSRPPERKTSNLMALLNDDPPPPPKRVMEVPAAVKPASTPPPQSNPSRPPPPPPPPSHVRRESAMSEAQAYDYRRNNPPPPAPSSMPSLKPYAAASPQAQPMGTPRHMPLENVPERDYYGGRPRSYAAVHQSPAASSPQSAHNPHHYPPPSQPAQMQYQQPQAPYPYGTQVQPQPPSVASPPPQYPGHPSAPRGHEPPPSSRDAGWPGVHQGHGIPPQHQQPHQAQPAWASHPPQPPKSTQPPPTQSAWAAQHAPTPKPMPPASSVPQQQSWATAPPPPRGHDPMALRDVRDVYPQHRMQALQTSYAPSPRAPEPPPPQPPAGYTRYSTPVPGRDPRDPGPPRSYTPVSGYDRVYQPSSQDIREAQLREQQSILQQQLRPQDRHLYERPPDRYGR